MTKWVVNAPKNGIIRQQNKALPVKSSTAQCNIKDAGCKGPALICNDVQNWLQRKCQGYQGLLVQRPQNWPWLQWHVDNLAKSKAFGEDDCLQEEVRLVRDWNSKTCFAPSLFKKACHIADLAVRNGLPEEVGHQIQRDFVQIGVVLANLVPSATKIILKLDIMGHFGCDRWHRDNYVGRAVVSYNLCGTDFTGDDNVDMHQLEHGGKNSSIIRDLSHVLSADVGDILFMKGRQFPTIPNGFVHVSPARRYHADGSVKHRLLLKVDLPANHAVGGK